MKVLKKSVQKNVIVDNDYYTADQIEQLIAENRIFCSGDSYRVHLTDCSEIRVVYYCGYYVAIVVMNDGAVIHVKI